MDNPETDASDNHVNSECIQVEFFYDFAMVALVNLVIVKPDWSDLPVIAKLQKSLHILQKCTGTKLKM